MCAFHDALQVGKQKEIHCTPLIWHPQVPDQGSTAGGLLSVSLPEEHREGRHGGNQKTWHSSTVIDS
jgi:hypothetical protein